MQDMYHPCEKLWRVDPLNGPMGCVDNLFTSIEKCLTNNVYCPARPRELPAHEGNSLYQQAWGRYFWILSETAESDMIPLDSLG